MAGSSNRKSFLRAGFTVGDVIHLLDQVLADLNDGILNDVDHMLGSASTLIG